MKVREKMTKNVGYVNPSNTVVEAAQLMQKLNVGSVPVFDQNKVVGVVTDRDIVVRNVAHGKIPQDTKVQDVMTSQVTTVTPDMDVDEVSRIMAQQQIRRVPVIENNQLVGILALGDMATDYRFDTEASQALTEISKKTK
ncbi:CBS domain-containing protein [Acetivibrio cellulolyticus]|uniref:CBS domain-containing protein n=1 Tax=Acetivibrio cellulolyticus TaxID=35830 RepID=UPI0001E2F11B|nr:CBS domain-containing protein [Acetivibrio cellulolyticus]